MGSNPLQAWIFFRPYFDYCSLSVHYCEDGFLIQMFRLFGVCLSCNWVDLLDLFQSQSSLSLVTLRFALYRYGLLRKDWKIWYVKDVSDYMYCDLCCHVLFTASLHTIIYSAFYDASANYMIASGLERAGFQWTSARFIETLTVAFKNLTEDLFYWEKVSLVSQPSLLPRLSKIEKGKFNHAHMHLK